MQTQRPFRMAALVLVAGLAATLAVALAIRQDIESDLEVQAAAIADEATLKISQQLWTYSMALRGGVSVVNGARAGGRGEWRAYVNALELDTHLPGVQGIGFAEWVPPAGLAAHEARVRAEGFPDYRVRPATPRDHYSAVVFLEPFRGRNLRAFGYDMFSDPVRRAAMERARDSGALSLSGKVRLLQEDGRDEQAGFLMYAPVYRAGAPRQSVGQRRAALLGWVYSPFRMRDMLAATFRDWRVALDRSLFLTIHDGDEARPGAVLFDNRPPSLRTAARSVQQRRVLEFLGHRWVLVYTLPLRSAGVDTFAVPMALGGGIVISLLLSGLVLVLGRTRERAQRLAMAMTADLRESERRLRESEEKLRGLEYRWKFALEGSDLGVWDWNVATGEVWFSPRWKEMLGFEEHEIEASVAEWEGLVHPDDLAVVQRDLKPVLEGRVRLYLNEHRLRAKDGSYRWILDRGMVVERDADGKPLRMLGTHADVTHAHMARERIQRLDQLYAALSACNSAIVRCSSEAELFAEVCQAMVNHGGVKMVWIGRVDPVLQRVQPVEAYGTGTEYLAGIEVSTDAASPLGQGPTGTAVRERRAVWSQDYAHSPALAPWHARGARYGWVASGALPVLREGTPVAVVSIYVGEGGQLDEEARALLEEMAADLGYALDKFAAEAEARASRTRLEEAEERFQALVEQSLAGAYIVQDNVLAYVNPRFAEIVGLPEAAAVIGRSPLDFVAPATASVSGRTCAAWPPARTSTSSPSSPALPRTGARRKWAATAPSPPIVAGPPSSACCRTSPTARWRRPRCSATPASLNSC